MAKKRKGDVSGDLFAQTEPEAEEPAEEKPEKKDARATYYISQRLKDEIHRRAVALGISDSQLAWYMLMDGLERLDAGEIDPTPHLIPSSSPAYRHNIDPDVLE